MQRLIFDKKEYCNAGELAIAFGYSREYGGKLCRDKKVDCVQLDGHWYVTEDSMRHYAAEHDHASAGAVVEKKSVTQHQDVSKNTSVKIHKKKVAVTSKDVFRSKEPVTYNTDDTEIIPPLQKKTVPKKMDITKGMSLKSDINTLVESVQENAPDQKKILPADTETSNEIHESIIKPRIDSESSTVSNTESEKKTPVTITNRSAISIAPNTKPAFPDTEPISKRFTTSVEPAKPPLVSETKDSPYEADRLLSTKNVKAAAQYQARTSGVSVKAIHNTFPTNTAKKADEPIEKSFLAKQLPEEEHHLGDYFHPEDEINSVDVISDSLHAAGSHTLTPKELAQPIADRYAANDASDIMSDIDTVGTKWVSYLIVICLLVCVVLLIALNVQQVTTPPDAGWFERYEFVPHPLFLSLYEVFFE